MVALTNTSPREDPFAGRIRAHPFDFDHPHKLVESLRGVGVLYNTYWVRFNHLDFTHERAIENSLRLFDAARRAGLRRIVHVSITNPSADSDLEYFRGKARLEAAVRDSGLSHAILRPTVLFGKEDILINNIAWVLRRLPVFGVFGDGSYRLQPIYVDDLAKLAVEQGAREDDATIDAIGPETFTYRELVGEIGRIIGRRRPIVNVPPGLGYLVATAVGKLVGDVVVTREEIRGLMDGLLYVDGPPVGATRLTRWAAANRDTLGRRYASELDRRRGGPATRA